MPQKRLEHTSTSYDVNEATEENNSQICLALDSYSDIIDDNKNTNRNQEIMVQSKKGMKLRDLLRPILHNQNIDIEKCSIYDQASLTASTSLVDLNDLCDTYSGSKLFVQSNKLITFFFFLQILFKCNWLCWMPRNMLNNSCFIAINIVC